MVERTDSSSTEQRWTGDRSENGSATREADRSGASPAGEHRSGSLNASASIGRRELLGALGTAAVAGLAGCSGGGGSSGPTIAQPESHTQDMTLSIVQDGTPQLEQIVHLERDSPDYYMDFRTSGLGDSAVPMFNGQFVKVDGTLYLQYMGMFCMEANRSDSDVQSMAATPQRFGSEGSLEQTETTTLDGVEVEVWESTSADLPLSQFSYQPDTGGNSGFGGQMPGGESSGDPPAYLDPDRIEEGTLKVWIGAENRYLRKAEQTAVFSADDAPYRFDMEATNEDFGEDLDIQAPRNCSDGSGGFGG